MNKEYCQYNNSNYFHLQIYLLIKIYQLLYTSTEFYTPHNLNKLLPYKYQIPNTNIARITLQKMQLYRSYNNIRVTTRGRLNVYNQYLKAAWYII